MISLAVSISSDTELGPGAPPPEDAAPTPSGGTLGSVRSPAAETGRARRLEEYATGRSQLVEHVRRAIGMPDVPVIATTDLGRPFVRGADLSVSLSHTRGFTATAVAGSALALGVDIERTDRSLPAGVLPVTDVVRVAPSVGTLFPAIGSWTAREAVGKALGIGLLAAWSVYEIDAVLAVGSDRPVWEVGFRALPFMRAHVWSPCDDAVAAVATSVTLDAHIVLAAVSAVRVVQQQSRPSGATTP